MKQDWERKIKAQIQEELASVSFSEDDENRILDAVHHQITGRSQIMKLSKKKMSIVLAAAMIIVGAVTVAGAGQIAYLSGGTNRNEAIFTAEQLMPQAEQKLGNKPKLVDAFADGLRFSEGYVTDVKAMDEGGNQVGSYPKVMAYYEGAQSVFLNISKPMEGVLGRDTGYDFEEAYQDILLQGAIDQYLFLPPDQEPSEADKKLEEEGKLMISYGSSEEERKTFKSVSWEENGLRYLLHSFDEIEMEKLVEYAKEIIDSEP